jgi:uncharacterized protein
MLPLNYQIKNKLGYLRIYYKFLEWEGFMIKKNILHVKLVSSSKIELFWNASELPMSVIQFYFNYQFAELTQVMRIYDVSQIIFNGLNAHHFFEIAVPYYHGSWTVKGLEQNRSYIAELGVKFPDSRFFPLLRSNCIYTTGIENSLEIEQVPHNRSDQLYQDQSSAWTKHVSTYSYYKEFSSGEKNG